MVSIWTVVKACIGIFLVLFILAVLHLVLTAPQLHNIRHGVYNIATSISPQLGELLKETYIVLVKITGYAYNIFKNIIDILYNLTK